MAYIGNGPGVTSQRIISEFEPTTSTTSFTPSSGYTVGYVDVYLNGIKLQNGTDFTASNGTNIVLTDAAVSGDVVEIIAYIPRGLSDGYTKSEADARYEPLDSAYTKAEADARYEPLDSAYTKAESDARYMDINEETLPDQTGHNGQFLQTDGTNADWATVSITSLSGQDNTATSFIDIPSGTTAQRPSSPNTGYIRFNTTIALAEYYDGTSWRAIDAPPAITSISPTTVTTAGQSITISGTSFSSGATVDFIGADSTVYSSPTVTVNNSASITATTPATALSVANEPYSVRVTNSSGLASTLTDSLDAGSTPTWTTSAGNVGTIYEDVAISSLSIAATDADGQSVSITSSDFSISGVTLASSGSFTGTPNVNDTYASGGVTHSFNAVASDGVNTTSRAFNIVRKWMDGSTSAQAAASGQAIRALGITTDGTYWIKPPGGSGSAVEAYVLNSVHGGGWVKFIQYWNNNAIGNQSGAYNAGGTWVDGRGGLNYGKLANSDIHALQSNGTNTGFLMTRDVGENGKFRYWRYVEGSTTNGHHPRAARIGIRDYLDNDYNIVTYVSDNCVDSGTYQVGTSPTYDHGSGIRAKNVYIYHVTTASRGANFTLQGSNDNSTWIDVIAGNMQASTCGIVWANSVNYLGSTGPYLDPFLNFGRGIGGYFTSSGTLGNFGTDVDPTTTYDLKLDLTSNGTWDHSVTYTNDTRGRCGHTAAGSKVWYSDHNYNYSTSTINGIGTAQCWSIGTNAIGTNLHWMASDSSVDNGQSDGDVYWGVNSIASAALWIK